MAPNKSKQADRKDAKKATKQQDDDETDVSGSVGGGQILEVGKALIMGSCLAKVGPKLQPLVQDLSLKKDDPALRAEEKKVETEHKTAENKEGEEETEEKAGEADVSSTVPALNDAAGIFAALGSWLVWHNGLGLAQPASGKDSIAAWLALANLELDWGPRKKRKGSPSLDRILQNLIANMSQYLHALLVLMMLRAFLFRSWFSCLPWLYGLQVASLLVPLDTLPQVELKFRVLGTMSLHALVWLFFLYEVVARTYFFEKIPLVGLFALHAHSVRPAAGS